jgi:hypothetical protein
VARDADRPAGGGGGGGNGGTHSYSENNSVNCGHEIANKLEGGIQYQQDLEGWVGSRIPHAQLTSRRPHVLANLAPVRCAAIQVANKKGGASHGLSKKFKSWLDASRNTWGAADCALLWFAAALVCCWHYPARHAQCTHATAGVVLTRLHLRGAAAQTKVEAVSRDLDRVKGVV